MNKISKKIISLVTMAAFVLTLVPAAAFAGNASTQYSTFTVAAGSSAGQVTVSLNLDKDDAGNDITDKSNTTVKVRLVDGNDVGVETTDATVSGTNINESNITPAQLFEDGVTLSSTANPEFTFSGLPTGKYTAQVWLNPTTDDESAKYVKLESAAPSTNIQGAVSVTSSKLVAADDNASALEVEAGASEELQFDVNDKAGNPTTGNLSDGSSTYTYVWAENEQGKLVDGVTFSAGTDTTNGVSAALAKATDNNYIWSVNGGNAVNNLDTITAHFNAPGKYTIYAGVSTQASTAIVGSYEAAAAFGGSDKVTMLQPMTVNVAAKDAITATFSFSGEDGTMDPATDQPDGSTIVYTINDDVTPSGVKVYTVTGTVKDGNGNAAANELIDLTCNKNGLQLLDSQVGSDANGEFEFRFTLTKNGSYDITVAEANDDASVTLTVVQNEIIPVNIATVKDGGYVLAGNDTKYSADYDSTGYFADAVQFKVTDAAGKAVEAASLNANDYTLTVKGPEGSKIEDDNLVLAWDSAKEVYTLQYVGNDEAHDLIPGEYTVKVAFKNSSKSATATFNAAKFGTVQEITTDLVAATKDSDNNNNNAITTIDDEVALGQEITGTAYLVDENGIKVQAAPDDLNIGINGSNSASIVEKNEDGNPFTFTLADNTAANESLIGTTVTVKVFDETYKKYVEKTLTIVKGYLAETLSFDPTEGPINEDNTVAVSVVDENDKVSKVNGDLYAYIEKQSNADAKVDLDVNQDVSNGKGELTLYSDQEGTVDVVVVVKADNGEMYGKTLTYTFGAVDPAAQNTVVMTIGSTDYVVNNDIISGDAAPYVDSNWRTMVPFRVLGETFGATVDWDQDNKTVTYTYGNTTLTMTIGSTTYTVNGEDKTMDTAPVLNGDRTYVPVRFVAEALGYEVTPLQDSTGLTASVVFQK